MLEPVMGRETTKVGDELRQLEARLKTLFSKTNTDYYVVRSVRLISFRYAEEGSKTHKLGYASPLFTVEIGLQFCDKDVMTNLPQSLVVFYLRKQGWDGTLSLDTEAESDYVVYRALVGRSE